MRPTIRQMRRADVPAVADLERTTFSMPWSQATFRGLLRRRDVDALIAVDDDNRLVGYTIAWGVYDQGELANICVTPEQLGSGLAPRLLEEVLGRLEARGIRQLFLEVREANVRARRFYERYGFREVGRRRRYYVEPEEDALVLYRALGEDVGRKGVIVIPEDTFEEEYEE
ncbi:MAG TPA: ribosomal protein S18-alanine N-acetyltransferase [Longimicrobiales bacterium]|nr:ribosomal protein S18-alanine N-acetyltransferase [Longimicrobiales bacterium]